MLIVKKLLPYTIVFALIGYTLTVVFGWNTLVTKYVTEQGITLYRFDYYAYLQNLQNVKSDNPVPFDTIVPQRTWVTNITIDNWYNFIPNNLAVVFNWMYFPVNFTLYIFRWLAYVVKAFLVVLGWPMSQNSDGLYNSVLIQILSWVQDYLYIPYI